MMLCQHSSILRPHMLAMLAISCIALLGCSKKDEAASNSRSSQVVARIGDQVVSIQELDNELRWNNAAHDDAAVKRALSELVTRKYLVQQAIAAKLDREPSVLLDLLRAREQVLAKAFAMRELSRQVSAISAADTDKYIADHPLRFAQRKVLGIEQIAFAMGAVDQALIDEMTHRASIDEVDQRLTDLGVVHAKTSATLNTSEIPDELLGAVRDKKPGEVAFFRSGQNGLFFSIKTQELRPLRGEAAVAVARQLQQQELAKAQASMTNFTAKMEAKFEGNYARIMSANSEAPPATN